MVECKFNDKQYDDVEKTIQELRSKHPKFPELYQADEILGRSYISRARFDDARAAFQRVIDHPQGSRTETAANSQFLIAETYLIQKQHREALLAYFKVYSSKSNDFFHPAAIDLHQVSYNNFVIL